MQMITAVAGLFLLHVSILTSFSEAVTQTNSTLFANCEPPPRCPSKTTPLYIQGFVAATNDIYTSETIIPAAYAAIDDINGNCSILSGYFLQLEFVNTKCNPSEATWQVINSIVLKDVNQKFLFLGGGCSLDTEPLAALAGRFYQIPFLSYGASSPFLSERVMFPTFFRTIPSEAQSNSARFAIMRNNSWERVATLHQTETIFSETVDDFHSRYDALYGKSTEDKKDRDLTLRSFTDDPEISLRQIKENDIRIIMGFFYEDMARNTMCQAYYQNLTTSNHVWMLPAWYSADWYNTTKHNKPSENKVNCTVEQMIEAVKYVLYLDSYNFGPSKTVLTDTGSATAEDFEDKFNCYLEEFQTNPVFSEFLDSDSNKPHSYRTFTYDGIWTMAFALDSAEKEPDINLTDFAYFSDSNVSEAVTRYMNLTNFVGVSGDVSFDNSGSRNGLNGIYQLIEDKDGELKLELIAIHDANSNSDPVPDQKKGNCTYFLQCLHPPQWKDGLIPLDRRRPMNIYLTEGLVGFFDLLIAVSIIVTIALLVFNFAFMCKPLIRDSGPHINNIIIVGCLVMLVTCFLLGVDSSNPDTDEYVGNGNDDKIPKGDIIAGRNRRYATICMLRLWFLTLGFTLSFGALFAKTWQIYHIYANPKLKYMPFKMWNFLIIMCVFLTVDLSYLSFWSGYAPFSRGKIEIKDSGTDALLIYEKCECKDFPYLIGALYVYKTLLALFGLFLAYESRNVKYIYINDSRFVSITMYIVVILVGIGAPLSLVLADDSIHDIDAAYALSVITIVGSCMSCLLTLTIPKFVYMAKGKDTMVRVKSQDEINVPDGLQLGRRKSSTVTVDQTETKDADSEGAKYQVLEKGIKLQQKSRIGSDKDSGVLVTGDENDTFSSFASTTLGTSGDNRVSCSNPLTDSATSTSPETDSTNKS